jgi:large subunit ribosomal protein L18
MSAATKRQLRKRRHRRVRGRISGTAERPRLSVSRSNQGIFAQLIDDDTGRTLASANWVTLRKEGKTGSKMEQSALVGKKLAEAGRAEGIEDVVFDRGGYLYHGRVKALAEAAREGGLRF